MKCKQCNNEMYIMEPPVQTETSETFNYECVNPQCPLSKNYTGKKEDYR